MGNHCPIAPLPHCLTTVRFGRMSFAHFTMPTRDVEGTAAFLEETLGYGRDPVPANTPVETAWLNLGRGQQIHIFYVDGFTVSPFEQEFGRHVAVFYSVP